jgi:hypothetical protein
MESLISQYKELHRNSHYGATSVKGAAWILPHIQLLRPGTVIDYGCGQSTLADMIGDLGVAATRYDPAIPAYSAKPKILLDLLVTVDVLEHIPEPELDEVMCEMVSMARNAIIVATTHPARTILPSGENAHATIKPAEWWRDRLAAHYPILEPIAYGRPGRAAFRTWPYRPGERVWLKTMTASKRSPMALSDCLYLMAGNDCRKH